LCPIEELGPVQELDPGEESGPVEELNRVNKKIQVIDFTLKSLENCFDPINVKVSKSTFKLKTFRFKNF
jgi:hypothetical protein